jgi:hypothetical protein
MHGTTHCGLGATACNPLRDTIAKFRPAYERRLQVAAFRAGFDLDAELFGAPLTGRDDAGATWSTLAMTDHTCRMTPCRLAPSRSTAKKSSLRPGETMLQAATRAGHLHPAPVLASDFAAARLVPLCTSVNGRPAAACAVHHAASGLEVRATDELNAQRRTLLQMLFVEGNHFCPSCEKSGNCRCRPPPTTWA